MVAASVGDTEQIAALLESDSSTLAVQDARGWNALVYAAVGGKLEAVKVLTLLSLIPTATTSSAL